MKISSLPIKNIKKKAGRTAALLITVILLAVSMLGGTLVVSSLKDGLKSLETRLGADIMVVPDEAKSKKDLESILLDGVPGYFYMDKTYLSKVEQLDGIEDISVQYYMASTKAGCCSMPVQIIGFDPESDFTVTPWIKESGGSDKLGECEIVAGCNINRDVGGTIKFFDVDCKVVSKLDKTGTELDNAVYATFDTIKILIEASKENSFKFFSEQNPDDIISSILINVAEGYNVDDVVGDINVHVKGVEAVGTKSMLSGISDSLGGVSSVIGGLIAVIWILALVILMVIFSSMINERKKEFAIYRVVGMSGGMLARLIFAETSIVSLIGALIGIGISIAVVYPFGNIIENELGMPFLTPSIAKMLIMALISLVLCVLAGALASARTAIKLSKVDTGLILREGN
ncbi:MAG: ABC transporter permease [Lachnospiraceae bacterium]|nr:ABC transporter permease [Lachnospiraceae bacterium]